ncbi:MAG: extracellular solute-binding protein [Promicromonosporaceae bacterium]|nr:extracellular solute-binding protein [Promicromonosporaceae bacterium]
MINIRRGTAGVATVATLAIALTACSSGGSASTNGSSASKGVSIDAAHSVGAMKDYTVGTDFKATEPVNFSLMYRDHPNYPVKDDWSILTHLKSDHNVSFTRTDIPLADFDAKKALLINSGDFPEIVSVTYPGQETQYVASGALLPVSDYFQYMPNFEKKVKDWGIQAELDTHKQADGKIYLLPGLRQYPDVQYSVAVNDDMWQKAGITSDPTTWDEFAQDLVKVKAANPGLKYGMSDRWNTNNNQPLGAFLQMLAPDWNTTAGWGYSDTRFDTKTGKFVITGTSDNYKQLVTFVNGMVKSGALDPNITQTDDQAIQTFINGQSAAISSNTQTINTDLVQKAQAAGKTLHTHLINLPGGPDGSNLQGTQLISGLMISAKAKDDPHFKALLQYIDWLYYSDAGEEFAQWGVQGETFTKDSSGKRTLLPTVGWNSLNPDAPKKLNADFGYSNGVFMEANGSTTDLLQSVMDQPTVDWTNAQLKTKKILPPDPAAGLNQVQLQQTQLQLTQIKDQVNTWTSEFITGKKPLSDWDQYVSQINSLGGTQAADTYNQAYAASKK